MVRSKGLRLLLSEAQQTARGRNNAARSNVGIAARYRCIGRRRNEGHPALHTDPPDVDPAYSSGPSCHLVANPSVQSEQEKPPERIAGAVSRRNPPPASPRPASPSGDGRCDRDSQGLTLVRASVDCRSRTNPVPSPPENSSLCLTQVAEPFILTGCRLIRAAQAL